MTSNKNKSKARSMIYNFILIIIISCITTTVIFSLVIYAALIIYTILIVISMVRRIICITTMQMELNSVEQKMKENSVSVMISTNLLRKFDFLQFVELLSIGRTSFLPGVQPHLLLLGFRPPSLFLPEFQPHLLLFPGL